MLKQVIEYWGMPQYALQLESAQVRLLSLFALHH